MNASLPAPDALCTGASRPAAEGRSAAQVSPDAAQGAGFGHHFDAARKQGGGKTGASAASAAAPDAEKAAVPPRKTPSKSSGASGKDDGKADDKTGDKTAKHGDGQSLATVMLDLFGAAQQALPKDAVAGTAAGGGSGQSATTAAAVTGAAWSMAALAIAPGDMVAGTADAAGQAAAGQAGDTTEGGGTQTPPGELVAVLAAAATAADGSPAYAAGGDGLAPHQDGTPSVDSAVNGLAAGLPQGTSPPVHALNVAAPAGSAPFAQELGQHIVWLGGQTLKQASIRLNPEQLGALDVKVSMTHDGHVDVSFTAQHPAAVTAVQQSLGQLGLMLAGQGLSLGQAHVGQQGQGHQGGASPGRRDAPDEADAAVDSLSPALRSAVAAGLLDTFA